MTHRKIKTVKKRRGQILDRFSHQEHQWEEYYRNRPKPNRTSLGTHGIDCGGGCPMEITVKDGTIISERPFPVKRRLADYPSQDSRCCQHGLLAARYVNSSSRIDKPLIRSQLLDPWKKALARHRDPVSAWHSIVTDKESRRLWQRSRGKGGFKETDWDTASELIAASVIYTLRTYGPDRVFGSTTSPGTSMVSSASGIRFLQLLGGVVLSTAELQQGLSIAAELAWGEQGNLPEPAAWFDAHLLVVLGEDLTCSFPADSHFLTEAQKNGSRIWCFSGRPHNLAGRADRWISLNTAQTAAFWLSFTHVILKEILARGDGSDLTDKLKQFTDAPLLVELKPNGDHYETGSLLRASRLLEFTNEPNGDSKFLAWDRLSQCSRMLCGASGFKRDSIQGKWNLDLIDPKTGSQIDVALRLHESGNSSFVTLANGKMRPCSIPAIALPAASGTPVMATTVFELMLSHYGVSQGSTFSKELNEEKQVSPFTPEWAERDFGLEAGQIEDLARDFLETALTSGGKCMVLTGAGFGGDSLSETAQTAAIHSLILAGCTGVRGGGFGYYSGYSGGGLADSWESIAFALDWVNLNRTMSGSLWQFVHAGMESLSGKNPSEESCVPPGLVFPQSSQNPLNTETGGEADQNGAQGSSKTMPGYGVLSPDESDPARWPRLLFIWNGDGLSCNNPGHEYLLESLLGTDSTNVSASTGDPPAEGKLDLLVDLNFRMDTSALYSDLVLPASTWYEKSDLNSVSVSQFIQPITESVDPPPQVKSEWQIFADLSKKVSQLAKQHIPNEVRDLMVDSKEFETGIAPDTLRSSSLLTQSRDYSQLFRQYSSLGPNLCRRGVLSGDVNIDISEIFRDLQEGIGGSSTSISKDREVCDLLLSLSIASNETLTKQYFAEMERFSGKNLFPEEEFGNTRYSFEQVSTAPRILLNRLHSDWGQNPRAYVPYSLNIAKKIPWGTETGRQQFFCNGQNLLTDRCLSVLMASAVSGPDRNFKLKIIQSKWQIGTGFGDQQTHLFQGRGIEPLWMNPVDAARLDIEDNEWVEVLNQNGAVVTRACLSTQVPGGEVWLSNTQRILGIPRSPSRSNFRGGGLGSLLTFRARQGSQALRSKWKMDRIECPSMLEPMKEPFVEVKRLQEIKY